MNAILTIALEKHENFRTSMGFEPVTSKCQCINANQLSYEATDGGSWSFVGSNLEPNLKEETIQALTLMVQKVVYA